MDIFPCTQCGQCCLHVDQSQETIHLDRGDGGCRHYKEDSKVCSIYDSRPDICRVDRMYELRYSRLIAWEEFVDINLRICTELKAKIE